MNTYLFTTTATMKPYNNKKWWIDRDIIPRIRITAENLKSALIEYQNIVKEQHYVDISNSALKNKNPMYVDSKTGETKQIGYVITAKTEFRNDENYCWSTQFIDLWIRIDKISNSFEVK